MINFKQILASTGLISGAIIALSTGSAQAFSLQTGEDLGSCDFSQALSSCETDDGLRLTAGGQTDSPLLTTKTVGGITGVGVQDKGTNKEIGAGESILLEAINGPSFFEYIELSFLYQPEEYDDDVFEVAILETDKGIGTLTITGDNTAEYSFNGKTTILNALSPSTFGNGGSYRIDNPFGNIQVGQVKLTTPTTGENSKQHDYSLVAAKATQDVPEPGSAAAVLGLGLLVARRSFRKQGVKS